MDFEGIETPEVENQMLEHFGDNYLEEAMRIIHTRNYSTLDEPLIHEAMCIVIAIYVRKVKLGEINKDKVLH